jgi:phosphoglycerol transferase MdoB-like AlkP superfamily enzyme
MQSSLMAATPKGFRAMAWIGLASNASLLAYSTILVIAVTFGLGNGDDDSYFSIFYNETALSYFSYLLYIPLALVGIRISWRLTKREPNALSHIRLFFLASIVLTIAETAAEAVFNLAASTGTASEIAMNAFGVLVEALILFYWDREPVRQYLAEYHG